MLIEPPWFPLNDTPLPTRLSRYSSHALFLDEHSLRQDVWLTLTDYNRLSDYVPNLTQSKVKPADDGTIRLWQEGAQKIVGFDFRASVEMFMEEHFGRISPCNSSAVQ